MYLLLKNKSNNKYVIETPIYSKSDYMRRYPTYSIKESGKFDKDLLMSPYIAEQMKEVLKKEYDIDTDMVEVLEYEEWSNANNYRK